MAQKRLNGIGAARVADSRLARDTRVRYDNRDRPMKVSRHSGLLSALVLMCLLSAQLGAVELPPGFVAETLATNLNATTAIVPAPDGRIFIADQGGRLLVWKNGAVL